jgi:AraC-like DNA-binding protein
LNSLLDLIDETLQFRYFDGAVTPLTLPHTTGWRTLPYLVTAEGEGRGSLEVAGRRPLIGYGGTAICVPAGVFHCCTMSSKRGLSRWSCTTYTILGGIDLFTLLDAPLIISGKAARRIGEINAELSEIKKSTQPTLPQRVRRKELGISMFAAILEKSSLRSEHAQLVQDSRRLSPVCQFIRENLDQTIGVDDLARRAHLSVARFHVVFRRYAGVSPNRYVQNVRVQRAQELLLSSDLSVSEVAEQVGVEDPFFFSRMFKKRTGLSPSYYRAQISRRLV